MRIPLSRRITTLAAYLAVGIAWMFASTTSSSGQSLDNRGPYQSPPAISQSTDDEIAQLIDQLGDDSFLVRRNAVARLKRVGLEAFDQLHAAQFHPDLEIELAARYLVGSLMVSWSKEDDPKEVRDALEDYGSQSETERQSRIELLAGLPDRIGLESLLRLTRFETSLRLSQVAALAIMNQNSSTPGMPRIEGSERSDAITCQLIRDELNGNERAGSVWLRAYADDLESQIYSAERWRNLISDQRRQVDAAATKISSRESVLQLVRTCASHASSMGNIDDAIELTTEHLDLVPPTTSGMIKMATWAIDHDLHPVVLELKDRFGQFFDGKPILLYSAAESLMAAGKTEDAELLAQEASKFPALPTEEEKEKWSPKQIESAFQERRNIALGLQVRGLTQWAEREFRMIIDHAEIDQDASIAARRELASLFVELQKYAEVVELLQPLADRTQRDDELKQRLVEDNTSIKTLMGDLYFSKGEVALAAGKNEEGRQWMTKAYGIYPENIDILIRMYRIEGDAAWENQVKIWLATATNETADKIRQTVQWARQGPVQNRMILAEYYNQYAWLVSNTEGDYELALKYSLESLKLETDGAKLDTCARCYFALKRYDQAIAVQKRAIIRMPHSVPLKRQLKEFEEARANAESGPDADEVANADDANGADDADDAANANGAGDADAPGKKSAP